MDPAAFYDSVASSSTGTAQGRATHLAMHDRRDVHELLPIPSGVRPISTRWVDVQQPNGTIKSRVTARGYEQALYGWEDHYAATSASSTLRLLLAIAALNGLSVVVGDCSQAFYQATLSEEVWVKHPAGGDGPTGNSVEFEESSTGP